MEVPSSTTAKINALLQDAYEKRINNLPSSIKLTEEALQLSKNLGDDLCIGKSLSQLSLFRMILGDFEESIQIANDAIEKLKKCGDEKGIADAKYTIAGALYKTDNYNLGLRYLIDCLVTYKKFKDYHNQSRVEKSMGTIYEYFGDTSSAVKVYESAIASGKKVNDYNLQSNAFNPLSGIYLNQGKIDKAMDMIEKSIEYKNRTEDLRGLAFALYGRGKVYTAMKEFQKAESDFLASEKIHSEMGEKLGIAMSYHKRGALYIKMDRLDDAEKILITVLEYSNKNNIILITFKANLLLHEIAKRRQDYKLALTHLQKYVDEKERVINDHTAKLIESYDTINKMYRLEQEAKIQKEKADIIEQKNIELDSFFYRISHDLKGPITSMMSLSYLAKFELEEEKALKFIGDYETQANRLNNILDGLLNLTKMSFNEDTKQTIDFEQIIQECIASYKFLENYDQVSFKIEVDQNIQYAAEWALINTIIQNLIENGIKYARTENNKPYINISVNETSSAINIKASDNGIGMDEETVKNVFSMFFRANRNIQGTGLGLHILKRAIEKLSGEVSIESELGKGSTFTVTLPR